MSRETTIGDWAVRIAKALWTGLTLVPQGSVVDRRGTDAWFFGQRVQIKGDLRIAETGNVEHEIYEKTKGNEHQAWRHSPSDASIYIFVTIGFALKVEVAELARVEQGKVLRQVNATSMGFLIPIADLTAERKVHHYAFEEP